MISTFSCVHILWLNRTSVCKAWEELNVYITLHYTDLAEFFRRHEYDEDERTVSDSTTTTTMTRRLSHIITLNGIIIGADLAVKSVPAALGRAAAAVAVPVVVVVSTVRVVDGIADLALSGFTVPAIVQTLLAATRPVAHAILEQVVTVDALSHGGTVAIESDAVRALRGVVVTNERIAFLLHIQSPYTPAHFHCCISQGSVATVLRKQNS